MKCSDHKSKCSYCSTPYYKHGVAVVAFLVKLAIFLSFCSLSFFLYMDGFCFLSVFFFLGGGGGGGGGMEVGVAGVVFVSNALHTNWSSGGSLCHDHMLQEIRVYKHRYSFSMGYIPLACMCTDFAGLAVETLATRALTKLCARAPVLTLALA